MIVNVLVAPQHNFELTFYPNLSKNDNSALCTKRDFLLLLLAVILKALIWRSILFFFFAILSVD